MRLTILLFLILQLPLSAQTSETSILSGENASKQTFESLFHAAIESRYFSEGRDDLDGSSLLTTSAEFSWQNISAGVWYGDSPDEDYDELQLSIKVSKEFGNVEVYLTYVHLRTLFEGSHDNEIGVGFTVNALPFDLAFSVDAYQSFEVNGSFWEASLLREFTYNEQLSFSLSSTLGVNHGYVDDGHDGLNYVAASLGAEYALSEGVSLTSHIAYSWAVDRDSTLEGDENLINFFHAGVGLQWSF